MYPLLERFDNVRARIDRAISESGRQKGCVRLVAISKTHGPAEVANLAGHWAKYEKPVFGENYLQEAREKMAAVDQILACSPPKPNVEWHFTGHAQSKKAKDIVGRFALIHSVGSSKLASLLHKAWEYRLEGKFVALHETAPGPQPILLQVNVGREPQKSGVLPEELEELAVKVLTLPGLDLRGLMCLPPLAEIGEHSRPYFAMLRSLRDGLEDKIGLKLPELSMGMSDDFEDAIKEGATLVRIGSDIFGSRRHKNVV